MEIYNPNGEVISSSMCEDLLEEILVRLPLKSLFRFKCVSKSWHGMISDDHFRRRLPLVTSAVFYRGSSDQDGAPRYAFVSDDHHLEECNLDFFPYHDKSTIIDSCNGLLLSYSSPSTAFYVVNPSVKRWVALPKPLKKTHLSVLAFDPCDSPDYKVVCFTAWRAHGAEIEVFSSETAKWTEHELQWGIDTDAMSATMHYFHGVLYVLAYPNHIVGINLHKMHCRKIELPEPTRRDGRIGHSGGRLHYSHNDGEEVKVWMVTDLDESNWVLKDSIRVQEVVERRSQINLLAFHPEREVLYFWMPGRLVSYDLKKKRIEESWEFATEIKDKAHLIQIWLFPFSCY
ncbi:putative F-box protein At1g47790 [Typha angustifolia]|uniref:putative F-box protein At1g47790 n=1 Tax=Typha angustifolia TaxID=59011 RepID=UPI003C2EFBD7